MGRKLVWFFALLDYALVLGVFWGTWFSLSRSIGMVSPQTFLEDGKAIIANLAMPMRFLMPVGIVLTAALPFLSGKRPAAVACATASALLLFIALTITLTVNVPIDNQIKTWTLNSLPSGWALIRDRWETFHGLRTFVSLAGFASLLVAALTREDP